MTDPILIVSIAAAILAAAAFLVAAVQAILTYVSWGPRHKCTSAAIGHTSKQVTVTNWVRFWSPRVRYPLLNLDWTTIITYLARTVVDADINRYPRLDDLKRSHEGWYWRPIESNDKTTWWNVAYDYPQRFKFIRLTFYPVMISPFFAAV